MLGYHYLGEGQIDTAIAILKKNVDVFPSAFNVYDSLGEAYMKKGMKHEAIVNYARSLVYNSENANAIDMLEQLKNMKKAGTSKSSSTTP